MKMKNGMYLFATAIVASTMGLASCSSDEEVAGGTDLGSLINGKKNDVTLALSVKGAVDKRLSQDEANMGTTIQTISNIYVVPMITTTAPQASSAYLNPIKMPNFTNGLSLVEETAKLNENINEFKVYGNISALDESKIFDGVTSTLTQTTAPYDAEKVTSTLYKPHGLYYYGHAGITGNQIYGGESLDAASTAITAGTSIKGYKAIKLSNVNYAVGMLAAGIINGDASTTCFYDTPELSGEGKTAEAAGIKVHSIIIGGQSQKLDTDFERVGTDLVSIYETATGVNTDGFVDQAVSFGQSDGKVVGASFYSVVAATKDNEDVSMNIVFEMPANTYIKNDKGETLGGTTITYLFLPLVLTDDKADADDGKDVFMKDYTTLLNATVTDWGRVSDSEVISTDVNIGVEINTTWQKGVTYEEEI